MEKCRQRKGGQLGEKTWRRQGGPKILRPSLMEVPYVSPLQLANDIGNDYKMLVHDLKHSKNEFADSPHANANDLMALLEAMRKFMNVRHLLMLYFLIYKSVRTHGIFCNCFQLSNTYGDIEH